MIGIYINTNIIKYINVISKSKKMVIDEVVSYEVENNLLETLIKVIEEKKVNLQDAIIVLDGENIAVESKSLPNVKRKVLENAIENSAMETGIIVNSISELLADKVDLKNRKSVEANICYISKDMVEVLSQFAILYNVKKLNIKIAQIGLKNYLIKQELKESTSLVVEYKKDYSNLVYLIKEKDKTKCLGIKSLSVDADYKEDYQKITQLIHCGVLELKQSFSKNVEAVYLCGDILNFHNLQEKINTQTILKIKPLPISKNITCGETIDANKIISVIGNLY